MRHVFEHISEGFGEEVRVSTDSIILADVVEAFERYLRGCGFEFGELEIKDKETELYIDLIEED